ncbi:MAG: glycosyl hydrolase family 18 protein, partial [Rudaea sp.]
MKARQNPTGSQSPSSGLLRGRGASILIYFVLLPLLACLVLILPPIQIPARILSLGYTSIAAKGAEVKNPDGAVVRIPEGAIARSGSIKLSATTQQAFSASPEFKALPGYVEVKSPLYNVSVQGDRPNASTLQIPVPNDAEPYETLDLWGQYNDLWFKLPFVLNRDDLLIESQLNFVPNSFFVAQTDPQAPLVAASITSRTAPQERAAKLLSEVNPTGLHLADQGGVAGEPVVMPETSAYSSFAVVPTVDNKDESGVRIDLTENMLLDEGQRKAHIQTLVDLAVQKLYAGYNIQYEGLTQQDSEAFTAFIKDLAREMHAAQKIVSVTLPAAKPVAAYEWDTEGYDWALIGRYADAVKIPMLDAASFEGDSPLIDQYLEWAAGQIDRYKLQVITSVAGRDQSGDAFKAVSMTDALKLVGPVSFPAQVRPGDKVTLELPGLKAGGGVQHHDASGEFYFNYKDDQGASHIVWLEDADSVAKEAALLLRYNMKGLVLQGVEGQNAADMRIWDVLDKYRTQTTADVGSKLTLVWTLDGNKIGTSPAASPSLDWTVPDLTGEHKLDVAFSVDDGQSFAPGGGGLALNIEQPKPTETPAPTKAPTNTPAPKPTKNPNATAAPTKAPAAPP